VDSCWNRKVDSLASPVMLAVIVIVIIVSVVVVVLVLVLVVVAAVVILFTDKTHMTMAHVHKEISN